jgi:hypothetical protein
MVYVGSVGGRVSFGGVVLSLLVLSGCGGNDSGMDMGTVVGLPGGGMFGSAGAAGFSSGGSGGATTLPPRAGVGGSTAGTTGGAGVTGMAGTMGGSGMGGAGSAGMAGGTAGGTAGMAGGTGGGGGSGLPPLDGEGPELPAIQGECPTFTDGSTIMVAGHRGIAIAAGAAGGGGPLLFYWHGTGGSAAEAMRTIPAAVRSEILGAGGIIAAFNGSQSSGTEGDCSGTGAHNMADFKAADQIAACAVMNHGIDSRRIYTTGCSAGGLQSGCMAQMRSSYIAATAPNSGGVVRSQPWEDDHAPAVFTMHGGSSDVVIVTFSQTSRTFDMAAKTHGSFVVNCDHGGGHCRAPAELQTAAWQFMKDHPWGFTESPWAGGIPAGIPSYCTIF